MAIGTGADSKGLPSDEKAGLLKERWVEAVDPGCCRFIHAQYHRRTRCRNQRGIHPLSVICQAILYRSAKRTLCRSGRTLHITGPVTPSRGGGLLRPLGMGRRRCGPCDSRWAMIPLRPVGYGGQVAHPFGVFREDTKGSNNHSAFFVLNGREGGVVWAQRAAPYLMEKERWL